VITDSSSARSPLSWAGPEIESDSALSFFEVVFTTLYADVKEPAEHQNALHGEFGLSSLLLISNSKNGRCLLSSP
jgi:hypothetical protein